MSGARTTLPIVNLREATFECTYGRGCEGICCRNGRPPVFEDEVARIEQNLHKFLPLLTAAQAAVVEEDGFVSKRKKSGAPMLRVLDGWCIFFNEGCVLHKVGAAEGDAFRYKPEPCSLFPLERDGKGDWYVRQHDYKGEQWDLFCLAPTNSRVPAAKSLVAEVAFAARVMEAEEAAKGQNHRGDS